MRESEELTEYKDKVNNRGGVEKGGEWREANSNERMGMCVGVWACAPNVDALKKGG